jgi:DNA-binding response OmpR family regulator
LVILDYQLAQGDGLHLLKQLRRLDPIVPIIGISGVAPAEVAAELVRAGADDYFEKSHLDSAKLAKAIRAVLLRAESLSSLVARQTATWHAVESKLLELCRTYAQKR